MQSAIRVFLGDRHDQTEIGFDQLALRDFGLYLALHDRLQCALQFESRGFCVIFDGSNLRFDVPDVLLDCLAILLLRVIRFAFEPTELLLQGPHLLDGAFHQTDEPQFFGNGKFQGADKLRKIDSGSG